jgi:hypothetical protein
MVRQVLLWVINPASGKTIDALSSPKASARLTGEVTDRRARLGDQSEQAPFGRAASQIS